MHSICHSKCQCLLIKQCPAVPTHLTVQTTASVLNTAVSCHGVAAMRPHTLITYSVCVIGQCSSREYSIRNVK